MLYAITFILRALDRRSLLVCGWVVVLGWTGSVAWAQAGAAPGGPPPVAVVVGKVLEQSVTTTIEVVGTVEPQVTTTLSAEIAGLVSRFEVREGDMVQAGKTVLAQLKATDFELALAEAEAEIVKAREGVRKLKHGLRPEEIDEKRAEVQERKTWLAKYAKDLERSRSLKARDMASISDLDQAESTYLAAKAQYERAQQSLRVAELGFRQEDIAVAEAEVQRLQARAQRLRDDVQKTTIRAPVPGVVTQRYAEVGQWLERGSKVADIVVLTTVLVRVPVHERDISAVRLGDGATVILDALPGKTFAGEVKHIIPQADLASRTFPVKIAVANTPDLMLKAGMFARVVLRPGASQMSLFVPKDAVVRRPDGQVVFVVQDGKARQVAIKTGRVLESTIEVVSGELTVDDPVIVTGNETLRDHAAVTVKETTRN